MITSRYAGLTRLHLLLQISGGILLFWAIVWGLHLFVYEEALMPGNYLPSCLLILLAAVIEFVARDPDARYISGLSRYRLLAISQRQILFALVAVFGTMMMSRDTSLSRAFFGTFFILYWAWISWTNLYGFRMLNRALYRREKRGEPNAVLVAPPSKIENFDGAQMSAALPGTQLLGYVTPQDMMAGAGAISCSLPQLGNLEDLGIICRNLKARLLVVFGLRNRQELIPRLTDLCARQGMRCVWIDDVSKDYGRDFKAFHNGSLTWVSRFSEPLEDPANRILKRTSDVLLSTFALLTVLPIAIAIAWTIHRLFSPGPLFYRQDRTGRDGEVFQVYKFRSMHVNDAPGKQASKGDDRFFKGSSFLRSSSIDELPQFLNVFLGQMSVVGPRPHFVDHDRQFASDITEYPLRQFAKPGITGLAQVKGYRGETKSIQQIRNRVRYDIFYVQRWSFWLDVRIILKTALQMIFPHKNAY